MINVVRNIVEVLAIHAFVERAGSGTPAEHATNRSVIPSEAEESRPRNVGRATKAFALLTWAILFAAGLAGCAAPRHDVVPEGPTSVRPPEMPGNVVPTGGIFQAAAYRPLFEDRKPRYVGDILVVQINEKLNASQTANSNTERKTDTELGLPGVSGILGRTIKPINATATTTNSFDGKAGTTSTNLFTGTITVTVIDVLANGNLRIVGEKRIGIRQNSEVLKFSGVINPEQIQPGNVISSTQVADARLDYRGGGYIEEAQVKGWLSRFFDSFSPF